MEQSETGLLAGMDSLEPSQPFPDELFYRIFEIEDDVERTQYIEAMRNKARQARRYNEFNSVLKAFVTDYNQRMRVSENVTHFTEQPLELKCGAWLANDFGVSEKKFDKNLRPIYTSACPHPILPVEIYKDIDTGKERVKLAYFKHGQWQSVTVSRKVCADNRAIVDTLSDIGIEVTSENAKALIRYLSDCIGLNPATLAPKRSVSRLGWEGREFIPYEGEIVYDGGDFSSEFQSVKECGSFDVWKEHCSILRQNKIVRLAFGASFGSVLIEKVNALPFVFYLWAGKSGTCKTVAVMAAMSIWGNPKMGKLVKTMDATKVGLMRNAAFLYSLPYAGDELQTLKDKWTVNFDQLIYRLTEGIDRVRGKASGGVEETRTWHCSFLLTGEETLTKANSRAGSKNRVIEVEVEEKLLENGNESARILERNHGHAGKILIEYLQNVEDDALHKEYVQYFDALCEFDTTEKQAMAMACILLADRILTEVIFTDGAALTVEDVKQYLRSAKEVDVAERSYQATINWIAKNPTRFRDPNGADAANKGEVWGRIDAGADGKPPVAVVNKDVLTKFLELEGYDYSAISKDWAAKERLLRNSQGKYVHQTRVYGIKASYVKIAMQPDGDEDGFMTIDDVDGQMDLPF